MVPSLEHSGTEGFAVGFIHGIHSGSSPWSFTSVLSGVRKACNIGGNFPFDCVLSFGREELFLLIMTYLENGKTQDPKDMAFEADRT